MSAAHSFSPPHAERGAGPPVSGATVDLFDLGRRASAARDQRWGGHRASFVRSRQWLATGAWRGPRDATESYVEAADLPALGGGDALAGWKAARAAGVDLLVGAGDLELHRVARASGARSLWRLAFRSGESAGARRQRLDDFRAAIDAGLQPWGVLPTPEGEAEGIDTLHLFATLRLEFPQLGHLALDVAALGPRLAQMALGFGADELWAPIVSERALRLGGNANNPAMTRKEACVLIRGAALTPFERTGPDEFREEQTP
jgi:aminodeoxyfutalosine synthase